MRKFFLLLLVASASSSFSRPWEAPLLFKQAREKKEGFLNLQKQWVNGVDLPARSTSSLRLVTFNVHEFRSTEGEDSFRSFLATLRNLDPQIVGLQEVDLGKLDEIKASLGPQYSVTHCAAGRHSNVQTGNVLITSLQIESTRSEMLPSYSDERCAIYSTIQIPETSHRLQVSVTHLDNSDPITRRDELKVIRDSLGSENAVIMGDFNAVHPEATNIKSIVAEDRQQKRPETSFVEMQYLRKAGFIDSALAGGISMPLSTCWSGRTVDFIIASTMRNFTIVNHFTVPSVASDHIPVVAELAF